MTPEQAQAKAELQRIAAAWPGAIDVDSVTDTGSSLVAVVGVDCRGFDHAEGGIKLRQREWFDITVPAKFPFKPPSAWVRHERWAGTPHVQWKRSLCLYVATAVEWNPSDGMYGFLDRLVRWLREAALNQLDPAGGPQHPPVAYPSSGTPLFIPRADTPDVDLAWWVGFAEFTSPADHRHDIVGWHKVGSDDLRPEARYAAAVLLNEPLPFEFPKYLGDLIRDLERGRFDKDMLYLLLGIAAHRLEDDEPLYVVVGTPMRATADGERRQHLAVWRLDAESADSFKTLLIDAGDNERMKELLARLEASVDKWAQVAPVEWCKVREARPEVTQDRGTGSPVRVFEGQKVAVWGCGAIGSHVAEILVRVGVAHLVLRDSGIVAPGVLSRQRFDDADVGETKAAALTNHLLAINPELQVEARYGDVITDAAIESDWTDGASLVIDATANNAVSRYLETLRMSAPSATDVATMVFGHTAEHGRATFIPSGSGAGPADTARNAKLAALRNPDLRAFADEFWPDPPRTAYFQPEPGCSEPTFTGSEAEVSALTAHMVRFVAQELQSGQESPSAFYTSLSAGGPNGPRGRVVRFTADLVLDDPFGGYEVRIAAAAIAELRAWTRRNERNAPGHETGGLLFGERDDALRVIWITDIIGPPPDSQASPYGFICGVEGVDDAAAYFRKRARGSSAPIGMWHTHPDGPPRPSPTDRGGMAQLVGNDDRPLPKQLLLIVGGSREAHNVAAYTYDSDTPPPATFEVAPQPLPADGRPPHRIGLALSGGGFRAVAFHLGVLRGLHDRGVLDHVDVVSSVSGGSIIAAMLAYSDDTFEEFDARVVSLLKGGLTQRLVGAALRRGPQAAGSSAVAAAGSAWNLAGGIARRVTKTARRPAEPPFRRAVTRTRAVEAVFATRLFGQVTLEKPLRPLATVINAAELRSGNAFRYGSAESGSSRFGRLAGPAPTVARAVAASAAYPVAFPAIDDVLAFTGFDGTERSERVLLTDGGVYDNLGLTALQPGRNSRYSTNVHPVDYIVSAEAGYGVLDTDQWPLWWPTRMKRSFESVYRKVQDAGKGLLHEHHDSGKIRGFALPFLGMNDRALPLRPPDLVPRDAVAGYPTNFAAMTDDNLALLTLRGEQLVRLTIEAHCPEIA